MEHVKEHVLPSGAKLYFHPAPFSDAKALYQAAALEARSVRFSSEKPFKDFLVELLLAGFSSPLVDRAVHVCLKKCLYNGNKIDDQTFEAVENREDYIPAVSFVLEENTAPFLKGLFAEFSGWAQMAESISQKPK